MPFSYFCRLPAHELGDLEVANRWGQKVWVAVVTGCGPQAPHRGLTMGQTHGSHTGPPIRLATPEGDCLGRGDSLSPEQQARQLMESCV